MQEKIERVVQRLHSSTGTASDVLALMSYLRQYIEHNNLTGFAYLQFFADWSVHPALDRLASSNVLHRIANAFYESAESHEPAEQKGRLGACAAISDALGLRELRAEIIAVLEKMNLQYELFTSYHAWNSFMSLLLRELADKPIQFPPDPKSKQKTLLESISQTAVRQKLPPVTRFSICKLDNPQKPDANLMGWKIGPFSVNGHDDVTIAGPMQRTEKRESFLRD